MGNCIICKKYNATNETSDGDMICENCRQKYPICSDCGIVFVNTNHWDYILGSKCVNCDSKDE